MNVQSRSSSAITQWGRRLSVPIAICGYLVICLFTFLILQGDLNNWVAFMDGRASIALFFLYSMFGVVGTGITLIFKKELKILENSRKVLIASFLLATIIGSSVFAYLNFSSTQANYDWMADGLAYQRMGQSVLINHEFIVDGLFTHHYAPVYPLYLSMFYAFLPIHLGTQIAVEIAFSISIIVVFLITKKLYKTIPALITTALIATLPTYLFATSRNYAEPMLLIFYTLTIFFILESLNPEKGNRIILAGLFAGLGFLTKSSMGYFFLLTGIAGFLWRFYYMKWRVLKNKNYVIAIVIFLAFVLTWTARNLYHFWDGTFADLLVASQPSQYLYEATVFSLTKDFGSFFVQFWFFMLLTMFFMLSYGWIFSGYLKKAFAKIRNERISCLMLSIVLPLLIGWIISAVAFVYENEWMPNYWITYYPVSQTRYFVYNLIRYCFITIVPLSWLAYEVAGKASAPGLQEHGQT